MKQIHSPNKVNGGVFVQWCSKQPALYIVVWYLPKDIKYKKEY